MKYTTILTGLTLFILSCSDHDPVSPLDATQSDIVNEINLSSQPITSSEITIPDAELAPLDFVGDSPIVGMGEASHGAKDFFRMKHRIFKYLVEKFNFKGIAFEMDVAEAMIFDDYIQGTDTREIDFLMKNYMIFWTWETKEVEELFIWMKSYNVGKPESDRIHLYGIDCQFQKYNADFLVTLIAKADQTLADKFKEQLTEYKQLISSGDNTNYSAIKIKLETIYQTIVDQKEMLLSKGLSTLEYEQAKQLSRATIQTQGVINAYKNSNYQLRDQYMADNVQWISSFTHFKIALWAHNYHISNDPDNKTMGYYLQQARGSDYKKIGFAFSTGTFNAVNNSNLKANTIDKEPLATSSNYLFAHAQYANFILRLDQLPSSSTHLITWVQTPHDMLTIGSIFDDKNPISNYYYKHTLQQFFDVIIYFNEITHSDLL